MVLTLARVLALAVVVALAAAMQQRAGGSLGDVGLGMTAPISQNGYELVAELRSDEEMRHFIQRVLSHEARYVTDMAELNAMVPKLSGTQSLEEVKKELRVASWVSPGEGRTAPLNEVGYQHVAALSDNAQMMAFAHRVAEERGMVAVDEGVLSGIVPHFSGVVSIQDFGHLVKEVSSLAGEGWTAPLNDFGYQKVAALKDNTHMMAFAKRILDESDKVTADQGALDGIVPYFSGEKSVQNFGLLRQAVLSAPGTVARSEIQGSTAELNNEGYQKVAALKDNAQMMVFAHRVLDAHDKEVTDDGVLAGIIPYFSGVVSIQNFGRLSQRLLSAPGIAPRTDCSIVGADHNLMTKSHGSH